ncbi:hypothetical protein RYA05_04735 [Pseudomonas syringae pv. actinidiae]|nr:hypothetical protein [Pseudomonas syringae pv. actinidiae]
MAFTTMVGNPYTACNERDVICVTTNGEIKKNGCATMGQGCAKFVRDSFKGIDAKLGKYLKAHGNRVFNLGAQHYQGRNFVLVTFPTKHLWRANSDTALIQKSAQELVALCDKFNVTGKVYIPAPGCSNGKLKWSAVKPLLSNLDERFVVYSLEDDAFSG